MQWTERDCKQVTIVADDWNGDGVPDGFHTDTTVTPGVCWFNWGHSFGQTCDNGD